MPCEFSVTCMYEFGTDLSPRNFEDKVSRRDYPDYYKTISRPTSISDARSLVEKDSIQDWDALAREVRLIWDNAKQYNQEDSDIYAMAEKLEVSSLALSLSPLSLLSLPSLCHVVFCVTNPDILVLVGARATGARRGTTTQSQTFPLSTY